MREEKAAYAYKPFLIKYRVRDDWGKWGHWLVRVPAYGEEEHRDEEFDKLVTRPHIEYSKATDESELEGQARAMGRVR